MKTHAAIALIAAACSALLCFTAGQETEEKVLICYYGGWSIYRPAPGNFSLENFDAHLCTHLVFAFTLLREDGNIYADADNTAMYNAMKKLREENKNLKLLLAIGGWTEGSKDFSAVAADEQKRDVFINSALAFLSQWEFDGIDIDWEFPADPAQGGTAVDKENLPKFLNALNYRLKNEDPEGKITYLLSIACGTGYAVVERGYDVKEVSANVDYINLMAYDLNMWSTATPFIRHHSPLYNTSLDDDHYAKLTIEAIVNNFIDKGADPSKLVLGVGTYGHTYTLGSRQEHNFGDRATRLGPKGPFSQEEGSLSYAEICHEIPKSLSPFEFDEHPEAKAPFAFNDTLWIGYESERSAMRKVDFAMSYDLAGMMIWSIEQDDCNNLCEGWYKCPIITAVKNRLDFHRREQ